MKILETWLQRLALVEIVPYFKKKKNMTGLKFNDLEELSKKKLCKINTFSDKTEFVFEGKTVLFHGIDKNAFIRSHCACVNLLNTTPYTLHSVMKRLYYTSSLVEIG